MLRCALAASSCAMHATTGDTALHVLARPDAMAHVRALQAIALGKRWKFTVEIYRGNLRRNRRVHPPESAPTTILQRESLLSNKDTLQSRFYWTRHRNAHESTRDNKRRHKWKKTGTADKRDNTQSQQIDTHMTAAEGKTEPQCRGPHEA